LMPVYNPDPSWLQAAIDSVREQLYPTWQLCIADDCSTDPAVRSVLERAQAADSRIHVVFRQENGHISRSSNSALDLVRGSWVALLDHDDLLPADALCWVARMILDHPQAQLIYSDEDKIDAEGVCSEPYFKPDWNPALIEGQNLFSHLGVYRTDLIRAVGGFRVGYEGSQDYDLLLRCLGQAGNQAVVHIPRVLYHWRMHRQSTASGNQAKPYVVSAAERALSEHLRRRGQQGTVQALPQGYRIRRSSPDVLPGVDVCVDAQGVDRSRLLRSLRSLRASTRVPLKLYVSLDVDQQSWKPELQAVAEQEGWSLDCLCSDDSDDLPIQALIRIGSSALVLFWDSRLLGRALADHQSEDWLQELISQHQVSDVVASGPKLIYPNRTISHAGLLLSSRQLAAPAHRGFGAGEVGYFGRANLCQDFSALPIQGLLIQRDVLKQVEGLLPDPRLLPHWSLDFCLRLRQAGGRLVYTPFAELIWDQRFMKGADPWSGAGEALARSAELMRERWSSLLDCDPSFSPNLCSDPINYSLAWPPRVERWVS
jgi:GT2 family glycosyltransferase